MNYLEFFCVVDLSLLPNLFNYLSTNFHDWTCEHLFCNLGYNPLLHYLFYLLQFFQFWPLEALSGWLVIWLWHISIFFFSITSLLSGSTRCSRLILYITCPNPSISCFFKESLYFFLENDIGTKIWTLVILNPFCA